MAGPKFLSPQTLIDSGALGTDNSSQPEGANTSSTGLGSSRSGSLNSSSSFKDLKNPLNASNYNHEKGINNLFRTQAISLDNLFPEILEAICQELPIQSKFAFSKVNKALHNPIDAYIYRYLDQHFKANKEERKKFFANNYFFWKKPYFCQLRELMYQSLKGQKYYPPLVKGHIPTIAKLLVEPPKAEEAQISNSTNARLQAMYEEDLLNKQMLEESQKLQEHQKIFLSSAEIILELVKGMKPNLEALSEIAVDSINKPFTDIQSSEQQKAVLKSNLFWRRLNLNQQPKLSMAIQILRDEEGREQPLQVIQYFLDRVVSANALDSEDATVLHWAVSLLGEAGKEQLVLQILELFFKKGVDPTAPDVQKATALHWAMDILTVGVDEQVVRQVTEFLLANQVASTLINAQDQDGKTALHKVISMLRTVEKQQVAGILRVIVLLLEKGANPHLCDLENANALQMASDMLGIIGLNERERVQALSRIIKFMKQKSSGNSLSSQT